MPIVVPKPVLPPLKPRPVNDVAVVRPKNATNAPRKRGYAGPFVFVNSSDTPEREEERRGNRRMVKRWAMLNRTNHASHQVDVHKDQCKIVTWDLATLEETEEPAATSRQLSVTRSDQPESEINNLPSSISTFASSKFDPFEALPIETTPHMCHLLKHFLNGGGDSSLITQARTSHFKRVIWPMILSSKAALYSLVALLEISPEIPIKSKEESFFTDNLSTALATTSALLKEVNKPVSPEVFCCTNYLIWIAHYIGDSQALSAHGIGLAALISRQWDVFSQTPFMRGGVVFWNHPQNEGNIIQEFTTPSGINKRDRFSVLQKSGFVSLRNKGYLSNDLVDCIPNLLRMDDLLTLAKTNNLSVAKAKELLSFLWYNVRTLHMTKDNSYSDFEDCIRQATIIYLYANIFADPANEIEWLAIPIKEQMLHVDTDRLLTVCPQALLWISLVVGPFAKGETRDWFFNLLVQSRRALGANDFQEAILDYAEQQFLWSRALDEGAEQLWDDTTWFRYGLPTPKVSSSPPSSSSTNSRWWESGDICSD